MVSKAGRPSTQGLRDEEQRTATAKMLDARRKRPGSPPGVQGFPCTWGFFGIIRLTCCSFLACPKLRGAKMDIKKNNDPA